MAVSPHEFTETALGHQLVQRSGANFRFVRTTGEYLVWNGATWEPDPHAIRIAQFVEPICCEAAEAVAGQKAKGSSTLVRTLESNATQEAVIKKARKHPLIVISHQQLDADPLLLGTPDGTIDLRTGELRKASRDDLITMSTSVAPAPPDTEHHLWTNFLETTFPLVAGDPEPDFDTIDFIQRWCGYGATGQNEPHKFAFFTGKGRNGKDTLFHVLRKILGDYVCDLPSETLMERQFEPHRAELAVLRGKRLVLANEIPIGKTWNLSRLNALSGGGTLTANHMRGDPFTFELTGKLWIAGNSRPAFCTVDTHIAERLMLIAMKMRFLETATNEADVKPQRLHLKRLLEPEFPAILRWIMDGARKFLEDGLCVPEQVRQDAADYLAGEDNLGGFISTYCAPAASDVWVPVADLLDVFNYDRRQGREKEISRDDLKRLLTNRGYKVGHSRRGVACYGLVLNDIVGRTVLAKIRDPKQRNSQGPFAEEG